jgi:hypothetical protein
LPYGKLPLLAAAAVLLFAAVLAGCNTPLDPQQYVAVSDIRSVQDSPNSKAAEGDEEDIAAPVTTRTRRKIETSNPAKAATNGGDAATDPEQGAPRDDQSSLPADVAEWKLADYLSAQRAFDPKLYEAVAYLFEKRAQDEDAAKLLTSLIEQKGEGQKNDDKSAAPVEVVLLDDALPGPSQVAATREAFIWVSAPTHPAHSGEKSFHRVMNGFDRNNELHACRFEKIQQPVAIGPRDAIFAHVYLDPDDPPEALMLGYKTDRWNGGVWGAENKIDFGTIRKPLGGLPETGKWVRLEIPAKEVELDGLAIQGLAFLQFGGTVYWDKAGVEKHPGGELVAPIIAALGRNKSKAATQTLAKLIKGEMQTALDAPQAARRAWKAVSANIGEQGHMDEHLGKLLLEMVSQPASFRPHDAEDFTADDLFKQTLSQFKKLATSDLRLKLAAKLSDPQASPEQLRELTGMLASLKAENLPAQLKLYQLDALDHEAALKFSDNFFKLSSAALADALAIKRKSKPKAEQALAAAAQLWTSEFSKSVLDRFIESQDAAAEPDAALLAMSMPLSANREALRVFYEKAGKTSGPRRLEEAGAFDDKLIDPGMIPVLKGIWHNDPAARRKSPKKDNQEELPLPEQWREAVRKLVQSTNERFRESGEEGMFEGKAPIALHHGANVTQSFSRDWTGADDDDLGELRGRGVGKTLIRYSQSEDELDERKARNLSNFYGRQISRSIEYKIDDETTWIDGLVRGSGGSLRSVDVVIRVERQVAEGGGFEPIAEGGGAAIGGGLGPPPGEGGLDPAVGGAKPPKGDKAAKEIQELRAEYLVRQSQYQTALGNAHNLRARSQQSTIPVERAQFAEQSAIQEAQANQLMQRMRVIEQRVVDLQGAQPIAPLDGGPAVPGGEGARIGEREAKNAGRAASGGKALVRVDVLIVEIDPPGKR